MAYNNGFPVSYPQMQYAYQQPMYQAPQIQAPQVQPQNQIQAQQFQQQFQQQPQQQYPSGFVRVANENEARMYPVAPGNSVTFIDENAPYCYTKTVDRSQLDRPKFDKYRLVKEEDAPPVYAAEAAQAPAYALKNDVDALYSQVAAIRAELDAMAKKPVKVRKEETASE